jgi:hypothetical protein
VTNFRRLSFLVLALAGACSQPRSPTTSGGVTLAEMPPEAGYERLGELEVQSGKGCGLLAERGSRDDATAKLRAAASRLGASYVHVTQIEEPRVNHQCQEHEYKLRGVAYRAHPASPAASANEHAVAVAPSAPTLPTVPLVLHDYEGDAALGKPAPATASSSVAVAQVPGDRSTALSVTFTCSGTEQRAALDVWSDVVRGDWRGARSVQLRIKPDSPFGLSVSFMDGHHTGYTQQTQPLAPNTWQTVTLPLEKFWHNPYGPPGDAPGAPVDLSHVEAFGFAPYGCGSGHFLIDDIVVTSDG